MRKYDIYDIHSDEHEENNAGVLFCFCKILYHISKNNQKNENGAHLNTFSGNLKVKLYHGYILL